MSKKAEQNSDFLKQTILFFLPLSLLIASIFFAFYWYSSKILMTQVEEREKNIISFYNANIGVDIASVLGDLRYLVNQHELVNLLNQNYERTKDLENDYLSFSKEKGIYDQIRILDRNGQEQVRINYNNGNPSVVPESQLQNKANRYYFKDTFKLDKDDIFISPLDLNVENGEIELPLKPMIRLGMPLFDKNGEKQGIILLNFLAKQMLETFQQMSHRSLGASMLINKDGYWLKGETEKDEWGFMYKDRTQQNFAKKYPAEWDSVMQQGHGQLSSENGLFSFETIWPFKHLTGKNINQDDYFWIIASQVTPETIYQQSKAERQTLFLSFIILACLLMALSVVKSKSTIAQKIAQRSIKRKNISLENKQQELEFALTEVTDSNTTLNETVKQLETALTEIKSLKGILPICSYCKEIRNDDGYWIKLEKYIQTNSDAEFSHSICDKCLEEKFPEIDDDEDE